MSTALVVLIWVVAVSVAAPLVALLAVLAVAFLRGLIVVIACALSPRFRARRKRAQLVKAMTDYGRAVSRTTARRR